MIYNLADLESKNPQIKYTAQKKILKLSASSPAMLYQDFDYFVGLADSKNNILSWTGILVLGNLAKVDRAKKIDQVLSKIIGKLSTGKMITAGNAIKALVAIGQARPDLANRIAKELLKVKNYQYDTRECSNIAIGHVLKNIGGLWDKLPAKSKLEVIEFAVEATKNSRPATAQKARDFIKKYEK